MEPDQEEALALRRPSPAAEALDDAPITSPLLQRSSVSMSVSAPRRTPAQETAEDMRAPARSTVTPGAMAMIHSYGAWQ